MSSRSGGSREMDQRRASATQVAPTPKPLSASERKTLATRQLVDAVGPNQNAAVTAALEAVTEWLAWDTALRQRISEKYGELTTPRSTARSASRGTRPSGPAPKPVRSGGSPAGGRTLEKLDPYRVLEDFGRDQLRTVLERDTQRRLRTAVDIVQERNPGTKPAGRVHIDDMVDYIVKQILGPGH